MFDPQEWLLVRALEAGEQFDEGGLAICDLPSIMAEPRAADSSAWHTRKPSSRYTRRMSGTNARDAETRRTARAAWPVVVRQLADSADDDLSALTDPSQRIAMMWPLAVEAWRLAGRALPSYARVDTPSRVFRAGEPRPGDDESG